MKEGNSGRREETELLYPLEGRGISPKQEVVDYLYRRSRRNLVGAGEKTKVLATCPWVSLGRVFLPGTSSLTP